MTSRFTLVALALLPFAAMRAQTVVPHDATRYRADTVIVHNGSLALRALLWRPVGRGPFPAILCNHGGGSTALGTTRARRMGARDSSRVGRGHCFVPSVRSSSRESAPDLA